MFYFLLITLSVAANDSDIGLPTEILANVFDYFTVSEALHVSETSKSFRVAWKRQNRHILHDLDILNELISGIKKKALHQDTVAKFVQIHYNYSMPDSYNLFYLDELAKWMKEYRKYLKQRQDGQLKCPILHNNANAIFLIISSNMLQLFSHFRGEFLESITLYPFDENQIIAFKSTYSILVGLESLHWSHNLTETIKECKYDYRFISRYLYQLKKLSQGRILRNTSLHDTVKSMRYNQLPDRRVIDDSVTTRTRARYMIYYLEMLHKMEMPVTNCVIPRVCSILRHLKSLKMDDMMIQLTQQLKKFYIPMDFLVSCVL